MIHYPYCIWLFWHENVYYGNLIIINAFSSSFRILIPWDRMLSLIERRKSAFYFFVHNKFHSFLPSLLIILCITIPLQLLTVNYTLFEHQHSCIWRNYYVFQCCFLFTLIFIKQIVQRTINLPFKNTFSLKTDFHIGMKSFLNLYLCVWQGKKN